MAKTYYQLTIDGAVATVHGPLAEAVIERHTSELVMVITRKEEEQ